MEQYIKEPLEDNRYDLNKRFFRCSFPKHRRGDECGYVSTITNVNTHFSQHTKVYQYKCRACERKMVQTMEIYWHYDPRDGGRCSSTEFELLVIKRKDAYLDHRARNCYIDSATDDDYDSYKERKKFENSGKRRRCTPYGTPSFENTCSSQQKTTGVPIMTLYRSSEADVCGYSQVPAMTYPPFDPTDRPRSRNGSPVVGSSFSSRKEPSTPGSAPVPHTRHGSSTPGHGNHQLQNNYGGASSRGAQSRGSPPRDPRRHANGSSSHRRDKTVSDELQHENSHTPRQEESQSTFGSSFRPSQYSSILRDPRLSGRITLNQETLRTSLNEVFPQPHTLPFGGSCPPGQEKSPSNGHNLLPHQQKFGGSIPVSSTLSDSHTSNGGSTPNQDTSQILEKDQNSDNLVPVSSIRRVPSTTGVYNIRIQRPQDMVRRERSAVRYRSSSRGSPLYEPDEEDLNNIRFAREKYPVLSRATSKACGGNSNRTASLIDPPQIGLSKSKPTLPDTAETAQERTDARRLLVMGKYIKKNPSLALTLGPEDAAKLNIDVEALKKKLIPSTSGSIEKRRSQSRSRSRDSRRHSRSRSGSRGSRRRSDRRARHERRHRDDDKSGRDRQRR
ncbi:C2H2-type domain-containing protein [Caenorhabditis elegans]|uniref:C2H2-type domain-containing protein n=1 Tax=Caenorhabditis elegans TaxID=6239 RepID=Q93554_CAEEL|nr:C2H2-type domain-containing protein [Caenorhabditis elegans]CAB02976.3 C2H2-type domain-containing protein [Caenorhabditis elegans]